MCVVAAGLLADCNTLLRLSIGEADKKTETFRRQDDSSFVCWFVSIRLSLLTRHDAMCYFWWSIGNRCMKYPVVVASTDLRHCGGAVRGRTKSFTVFLVWYSILVPNRRNDISFDTGIETREPCHWRMKSFVFEYIYNTMPTRMPTNEHRSCCCVVSSVVAAFVGSSLGAISVLALSRCGVCVCLL